MWNQGHIARRIYNSRYRNTEKKDSDVILRAFRAIEIGMSTRAAAREFNLPKTTLRRHLRNNTIRTMQQKQKIDDASMETESVSSDHLYLWPWPSKQLAWKHRRSWFFDAHDFRITFWAVVQPVVGVEEIHLTLWTAKIFLNLSRNSISYQDTRLKIQFYCFWTIMYHIVAWMCLNTVAKMVFMTCLSHLTAVIKCSH